MLFLKQANVFGKQLAGMIDERFSYLFESYKSHCKMLLFGVKETMQL